MERSVHDEFLSRMIEEVKKMKVGDPLDRSTAHGPQNHKYVRVCVRARAYLQPKVVQQWHLFLFGPYFFNRVFYYKESLG